MFININVKVEYENKNHEQEYNILARPKIASIFDEIANRMPWLVKKLFDYQTYKHLDVYEIQYDFVHGKSNVKIVIQMPSEEILELLPKWNGAYKVRPGKITWI